MAVVTEMGTSGIGGGLGVTVATGVRELAGGRGRLFAGDRSPQAPRRTLRPMAIKVCHREGWDNGNVMVTGFSGTIGSG